MYGKDEMQGLMTDKHVCFVKYGIVVAVACIIFVFVYGTAPLHFTDVSWLHMNGHLTENYMGWLAYRNGEWMFPIGLSRQISYPTATSVIFTDSIPLFALFFKLFRGILPDSFQYFGLWGVLCFVLQGCFAVRILSRFIDNALYVIACSVLFLLAPVMLMRMYFHTALAAHWLVLLAFELYFSFDETSGKQQCIRWAVLGALCASVHLYFFAMCIIILLGTCMRMFMQRKWQTAVIIATLYILCGVMTVFLLGGFSSGMNMEMISSDSLYTANLTTLINPQGWSKYLHSIPVLDGQYEGFGYMGLGMLMGGGIAVAGIAVCHKQIIIVLQRKKTMIPIMVMVLCTIVASCYPVFAIGRRSLFDIRLTGLLDPIWNMFRSNGRMIWILVYLLMIAICVVIYKMTKGTFKRYLFLLIAVLCFIQVRDLRGLIKEGAGYTHLSNPGGEVLEEDLFWSAIAEEGIIRHIVFAEPFHWEESEWQLVEWALWHGMTVNEFPFARDKTKDINVKEHLATSGEDTMFVFISGETGDMDVSHLTLYRCGDMLIGYGRVLPVGEQFLE